MILVGFKAKNKGYGFWPFFFGAIFFLGLPAMVVLGRLPFRCRRCDMPMKKDEMNSYSCPSCRDAVQKSPLGHRVLTEEEIAATPKEQNLTIDIQPPVLAELTNKYGSKTTEQLKDILKTKKDGQYSDRAYRVIETIVRGRIAQQGAAADQGVLAS